MATSVSPTSAILESRDWQQKLSNASLTAGFLHVTDVLKSTQQKHPDRTVAQIVNTSLFSHRHGLLTGLQTNYFRRAGKDVAKWTMIESSQQSIMDRYPELFEKNSLMANVLTAAIVASFDTLVLFPVDLLNANRIKHSTANMSYLEFARQSFKEQGIRGFYRGAAADLNRQFLGWSSFLIVDGFVKEWFDRTFPENPSPVLRQFVAANAIAGSYLALAQPFDSAKFQRQIKPELKSQSTLQTIADVFKTKGFRGLYGGAAFTYLSIVGRSLIWGKYKDKLMATEKSG